MIAGLNVNGGSHGDEARSDETATTKERFCDREGPEGGGVWSHGGDASSE